MIPYNFHTHTPLCKHAVGSEREYVEAALEVGMKRLGFSDHCPVPFKTDYISNIRMDMDQAEGYVKRVRDLADEFKKDIEIYVGFECEYVPEFYQEQMSFFSSLGIDYLIMGEHFFENEELGEYSGTANRNETFLKNYVDKVIEGMETGSYLYVAHPDIVNYSQNVEIYEKEMRRLCLAAKRLDIPLEVNALGLEENKQYPNPLFWQIVSETGCKGVIGMDAHWPLMIKNQPAYDRAKSILTDFNIVEADLECIKNKTLF